MLKKIFLVIFVCTLVTAGFFAYALYKMSAANNTSVNISDSDGSYQFYASFTKKRTRQVQKYLDDQLNTNKLFRNATIDAMVTLDDNTNVYIRTTPGRLLIKLDKNENTVASYHRIKRVGEQIKMKLAD